MLPIRDALVGLCNARKYRENLFHVRDAQGCAHAVGDSHQAQALARILVGEIPVNKAADTRGIDVWHARKIDDQARSVVCPDKILKLKEIRKGQRSIEFEHPATGECIG